MTKRMIKSEAWTHKEFVLTNAKVAEQGHLACLDTATGEVLPGEVSTTLVPIGWFDDSALPKAGITGDGSLKVNVRLFQELELAWFDNDTAPNNVAASDVGNEVYIKDSATVSTDSTGRSKAGRVMAVSATKGVLIQAGFAVTGPTGGDIGAITGGGVATRTALAAIAAADRYEGKVVLVRSDYSLWVFDDDGTATEDAAQELIVEPDAGAGQWLRADKSFVMKLPVDFSMADAAALCTIPAGMVLRLTGLPFWEVTTSWTGGSSSTIGVSTDVTGYDTQGDLLGGAAGDAAAALTAGIRAGTLGGELDDHVGLQALALVEGDVIRYDEITSAFTAGAGFVCLPVAVMRTA